MKRSLCSVVLVLVIFAASVAAAQPVDSAGVEPFVLDPDTFMEVVDVEEDRPDAVFQLDIALPPAAPGLGMVPMVRPSAEWVYTLQNLRPRAYAFSFGRFAGGLAAVGGSGWLLWHDVRDPAGDVRWARTAPAVFGIVFGLWQMSNARRVIELPVDAVLQPAGVEFQRVFEW